MLAIRTILYPTDFSPIAYHAFEVASALAHDYKARLVLLHVHEPPVPMGELVPTELPGYREALRRDLQALKPAQPIATEYRLEEGTVAEGILRVANETKCDVIVLGTHGRSGLGRILLGSVAESVLREASCLVLTVKTGAVARTSADSRNSGTNKTRGG
jgi:nucleotide-binding universal stress UspA family protein